MMCLKRTMITLSLLFLLTSSLSQTGRAQDQGGLRAAKKTFLISGVVGLPGVVMKGLPGESVAGVDGSYKAEVPYEWSGKVTPYKEGYRFEPPSRTYSGVTMDLRMEDYTAQVQMVTISNHIEIGNEPIAEVRVTAEPGGQSVLTDLQGRYAIQVPYGWTGRLIFSKEGFAFEPDGRSFTNVTEDIIAGESASSREQSTPRLFQAPAYPRAVLPVPSGNVFVIPTRQVVPQKVAETADDLRIMLQIFREKLSEPRLVRGAFVDFGDFFNDRDRALEAFYLQGSAAVFVLEMDAPFSFTPQATEGQATQESVDAVWQRARQKLYSPQDPTRGPAGLSGEAERIDFQQLKDDLLKTFRHAANLRNLEPNESVILTIIAHDESDGWSAPARAGGVYYGGGAGGFSGASYSASGGSFGPNGGSTYADSYSYSRGSPARPGGAGRTLSGAAPGTVTTLTIQARKADVDAHARGALSFEQFQQRVTTFTY